MRMRGAGMMAMGKGSPRGVEEMIYPPRANEVLIPHKNFANTNNDIPHLSDRC